MPRPPTDTRDEIRNKTREKLLAAAAEEFAQKGFVGANINQISTAAGFAKGTIYNYFSSKHDLMLALIGDIGAQHTQYILERVNQVETPTQRLEQFFRAGYAFVEQFPNHTRVVINVIYGHDQEMRDCFFQAYQVLIDHIFEDIVSEGITQGDFKPSEGNITTALIMSLYLGSISIVDPKGSVWMNPESVVAFAMGGMQNLQEKEME